MIQDTNIALIEFKGTTLPAIAITLRSLDPRELASAGNSLFGDGGFFDKDLAILDLQMLEHTGSDSWHVITDLLGTHGLRVIGVTRGNPELTASATAHGLPNITVASARNTKSASQRSVTVTDPTLEMIPASLRKTSSDIGSEAQPSSKLTEETFSSSMILDKPLRSGQQIYAKGADLIILAAVNPGAEVIADGNIHIYAPLRGRALAGARGNHQARILTTSFAPELISIAGIYKTYEDGIPANFANNPIQIRLIEDPSEASASNRYRLDVDILRVD